LRPGIVHLVTTKPVLYGGMAASFSESPRPVGKTPSHRRLGGSFAPHAADLEARAPDIAQCTSANA
jgi:hypothetical protein